MSRQTIAGLLVYCLYLLIFTWSPFAYSPVRFQALQAYHGFDLIRELIYIDPLDWCCNVLLFIPYGFLLYPALSNLPRWKKWFLLLFSAALLSGVIEIGQLFLNRSSALNDWAMNVFGAWLGARLAMDIRQKQWSFLLQYRKPVLKVFSVFYGIFLVWLSLLPLRWNTLDTWDSTFPLLLGNEATGDRPWNGVVSQLAFFNKSLGPQEIRFLSQKGVDASLFEKMSCVAFFPFHQGTLSDSIGSIPFQPISTMPETSLTFSGGIRFSNGSYLRTPTPPSSLIQAFQSTSAFSLAIWMQSLDLTQKGPARIVSLSESPTSRNFTLGQEGRDLHFRVRTFQNGSNGSRFVLIARSALQDTEMHCIVATFHHGMERIFLDGKPLALLRQPENSLPDGLGLGRNWISQLACGFALLFPLGFFVSHWSNRKKMLLGILVIIGFYFCIQLYYFIQFGQPFLLWKG